MREYVECIFAEVAAIWITAIGKGTHGDANTTSTYIRILLDHRKAIRGLRRASANIKASEGNPRTWEGCNSVVESQASASSHA